MKWVNKMKSNENTNPNVTSIFQTLVLRKNWPDSDALNLALREKILSDEMDSNKEAGGDFSNVGGWHSEPVYHHCKDECFRIVMERIQMAAVEVTEQESGLAVDASLIELSAWANVNRSEDYNNLHGHPLCTWAAVYYVQVPDFPKRNKNDGAIELIDPRPAATASSYWKSPMRKVFHPTQGTLIMFPGWLLHSVNPFQGSGTRISIGCDVRIEL